MNRSAWAMSGCLAVIALSACSRDADESTAATPAVVEPATDAVATPEGDSPSMRYSCEGGYTVAIVGDSARVTTQDGRMIELARAADRSPPLFSGEALEFTVASDGAVLGQDEGGAFACQETD